MKKKHIIIILFFIVLILVTIMNNNYSSIKTDAVSSAQLDTMIWGVLTAIAYLAFFVSLLKGIISLLFSKSNPFTRNHKDISLYELKDYLPTYDLNKLKKEIINTFIGVQDAYDKYNYKRLKYLCTNELYNVYYEELKNNELNHKKNNNNYKINDIIIYKITSTKDCVIVHTYISVDINKITNNYKLIFLKSKTNNITICPNCSSELKITTNITTCPYCNSIINTIPNIFILSSKRDIDVKKYKEVSFNEEFFFSKVKNIFIKYLNSITEDNLKEIDHFIDDKLYHETKNIIDSYKDKNIKKVYKSIDIKYSNIEDLYTKDNKNIMEVSLIVNYITYELNLTNKTIIGSKEPKRAEYLLTLSKPLNTSSSKTKKCPGCGSSIDVNNSGRCPYCDTIYNQEDYDYVLTNIKEV